MQVVYFGQECSKHSEQVWKRDKEERNRQQNVFYGTCSSVGTLVKNPICDPLSDGIKHVLEFFH